MKIRVPQRVLITAEAIVCVWTYVVDLARELDRVGIHVTIAAMGDSATTWPLGATRSPAMLGDIDSLRELWSGATVFVDPDDEEASRAAGRTAGAPSPASAPSTASWRVGDVRACAAAYP